MLKIQCFKYLVLDILYTYVYRMKYITDIEIFHAIHALFKIPLCIDTC